MSRLGVNDGNDVARVLSERMAHVYIALETCTNELSDRWLRPTNSLMHNKLGFGVELRVGIGQSGLKAGNPWLSAHVVSMITAILYTTDWPRFPTCQRGVAAVCTGTPVAFLVVEVLIIPHSWSVPVLDVHFLLIILTLNVRSISIDQQEGPCSFRNHTPYAGRMAHRTKEWTPNLILRTSEAQQPYRRSPPGGILDYGVLDKHTEVLTNWMRERRQGVFVFSASCIFLLLLSYCCYCSPPQNHHPWSDRRRRNRPHLTLPVQVTAHHSDIARRRWGAATASVAPVKGTPAAQHG